MGRQRSERTKNMSYIYLQGTKPMLHVYIKQNNAHQKNINQTNE